MNRTLIVARMDPTDSEAVAKLFAESDATELPGLVGVSHRALFSYHGLYLHLIESESDVAATLPTVRGNPLFVDVNTRLASHIRPYDPNWKEPKDAVAQQFYAWTAPPA
ncbi:MAG TPA: TcmI family type II polyketide cyclase [Mycobacteriales bacterium]|nr:TcmI family type II polyketide cyclase [Mycobacteriales bacterium]